MQKVSANLKLDAGEIGQFCRRHRIARLELFGSALRGDFNESSDVDFLATLRADAHPTLLDWAEMQEELAKIVGRPVDIVSRRALERSRNSYRKEPIFAAATAIYAEG
jgi:predicted nucleotidyltransferase